MISAFCLLNKTYGHKNEWRCQLIPTFVANWYLS